MKCFDCVYFAAKKEFPSMTCRCMKANKNLEQFILSDSWFVNDYNIKTVKAPDWCPLYEAPEHEEDSWESLRAIDIMKMNP